jgi:motility quorum-sensing regulator/GCU-specific mRNA interferase toxin
MYNWQMEKRKPHYRLLDVQAIVADTKSRPFTKTALDGGRLMGLTEKAMREIVCALTSANFFKSMTTLQDHTIWQDVYHAAVSSGEIAYIKITGYTDGRPPVIQFKAK